MDSVDHSMNRRDSLALGPVRRGAPQSLSQPREPPTLALCWPLIERRSIGLLIGSHRVTRKRSCALRSWRNQRREAPLQRFERAPARSAGGGHASQAGRRRFESGRPLLSSYWWNQNSRNPGFHCGPGFLRQSPRPGPPDSLERASRIELRQRSTARSTSSALLPDLRRPST